MDPPPPPPLRQPPQTDKRQKQSKNTKATTTKGPQVLIRGQRQAQDSGAGGTEQITKIRHVLQQQAKLLLEEATDPCSQRPLRLKAMRFVECFRICLKEGKAAFGYSTESNRTLNMLEAGYSEEQLFRFYHDIHQAFCVIYLHPVCVQVHPAFVKQTKKLYSIFNEHHPKILEWSVRSYVSLAASIWLARTQTRECFLDVTLDTKDGQSFTVPFNLRAKITHRNFMRLQKLLGSYWKYFSGSPCLESQYLNVYLSTLEFTNKCGGSLAKCLKFFRPIIRPKTHEGLDVFAKILVTIVKLSLAKVCGTVSLAHWFKKNWTARGFSSEEVEYLRIQLGKHWTDLFLASPKSLSPKDKRTKLQLQLQLQSLSNASLPSFNDRREEIPRLRTILLNDSFGNWLLNWTLNHPPTLLINPERIYFHQSEIRIDEDWVVDLFQKSNYWLPVLSHTIGMEYNEYKRNQGSQALEFHPVTHLLTDEPNPAPGFSSISPTWSTVITEWIQGVETFFELYAQPDGHYDDDPSPPRLLVLISVSASIAALSHKFLLDHHPGAKTNSAQALQMNIVASSLYPEEFWIQLKRLLLEAWLPFYATKIWFRRFVMQKIINLSTALTLLENIVPPSLTRIFLSWITPWFPNELQKQYLNETKPVARLMKQRELLRECTLALSSSIFKSQSARVSRILKLGLKLENPAICIGIFSLIRSVDPVVVWGLGKTPNDCFCLLQYIEHFVTQKSHVYKKNFELEVSLAGAISRLPCALNLQTQHLAYGGSGCLHCDHGLPFQPDEYSQLLLQATHRILILLIPQTSTPIHQFIINSIPRIRVHSGNSEPLFELHKGFLLLGKSNSLAVRKEFLTAYVRYHLPTPGQTTLSPISAKNIQVAFLQLKSNLLDCTKGLILRVYHVLDSLEPIALIKCKEISNQVIQMGIFLIYIQSNSGVSSRAKRLLTNIASTFRLKLSAYVRQYRYEISELIVDMLCTLLVGLPHQPLQPLAPGDPSRNRTKMSQVLSGLEVMLGLRHSDFRAFYVPVLFQVILIHNSHSSASVGSGSASSSNSGSTPSSPAQNGGRELLLEEFQAYYGLSSVREMLELNFSTYFTNMVLLKPPPPSTLKFNINKVLKYLKTKGVNPELVASISLQTLMNELLSYLSTDRPRVLVYLNSLILWQKGRVHRVPVKSGVTKDEILEFLIPRLTGFYMYVHRLMDSGMEPVQRKTDVFLGLVQLMEFVGPAGVTPTKARLLTLFHSMTKYPFIQPLLVQAWKTYALNLDDSSVPGTMSQIIPIVLHLHKIQGIPLGTDFDELCSYFILEKKDLDPVGVQDVFYVENYTTNPQVLSVLSSAKRKGIEHFEFMTNGIRNSNAHIQYQSLLAIRRVLTRADPCVSIQNLIEDSRLIHPQITHLVLALIHGSTSGDSEVSVESLKLLGELGALDFLRLRPPPHNPDDSHGLHIGICHADARPHPNYPDPYFITTDAFALIYMKTIARYHLAGNDPISAQTTGLPASPDYDLFGLVLQETSKMWDVDILDNNWSWNKLSAEERSLIYPLINSRYNVRDPQSLLNMNPNQFPSPIFGSATYGPDHTSWVTSFTHLIYSFLSPGPVQEFFKVNFHIVGKGLGISELLLSRIILYGAIEGNSDQRALIRHELTAVCTKLLKKEFRYKRESQAQDLDTGPLFEESNGNENENEDYDLDSGSGISQLGSAHGYVDERELTDGDYQDSATFKTEQDKKPLARPNPRDTQSIDLVFSILDTITILARLASRDFPKISNLAFHGGPDNEPPADRKILWPGDVERITYKRLESTFVQDIYSIVPDPRILAQAAVQLESYPRALLMIEEFLHYFPEKLEENFPLLQRIYVALEDVDSVLGISEKRKRKASLVEDTLDLLVSGKKESALHNFEIIIQKSFHEFMSQEALLQSYLAVATPEMALTILDGITSRKGGAGILPKSHATYSSLLQECRIEACIKLGKWDSLGIDIRPGRRVSSSGTSNWTFGHAMSLLQFQQARYPDALATISLERSYLLGHLRAGSMGSNGRADARPNSSAIISLETYQKAYGDVGRLHILAEMEQAVQLMANLDQELEYQPSAQTRSTVIKLYKTKFQQLLTSWTNRLTHVQKSLKIWDPILSSQKAVLSLLRAILLDKVQITGDDELQDLAEYFIQPIREASLQMAKLELKDRNFVRAYSYLQEAKRYPSPDVYLEEAKLLGLKGNVEQGIKLLNNCLSHYFSKPQIETWTSTSSQQQPTAEEGHGTGNGTPNPANVQCSRVLLALARLQDSRCLVDIDQNIFNYLQATQVNKKCEKNFFSLASYYYSALTTHTHIQANKDKKRDYEVCIVEYYCRSLHYGCKHVYQSLPRLLTIWFDFGSEFSRVQATSGGSGSTSLQNHVPKGVILTGSYAPFINYPQPPGKTPQASQTPDLKITLYEHALKTMTKSIDSLLRSVPEYIFFTSFSQLISRICHSNPLVWYQLKSILIRLILFHPHQALWNLMAVLKSTYSVRKARCEEILSGASGKNKRIGLLIRDYPILASHFIQLANFSVPATTKFVEVGQVAPKLAGLFSSSTNFSKILLPFNDYLTLNLPRTGTHSKEHKPFSTDPVYFTIGRSASGTSASTRIEVMHSLVRPKKVPVVGSNGKIYHILIKPSDDLRKDSKVMELNQVVNWYLGKRADARERFLHVNTYAVVPLNEETGLLEWIPNLAGLRGILAKIYKDKKLGISPREMKTLYPNKSMPIEVKRRIFLKDILKNYPPVFREWFLDTFPDPREWWTARRNYVYTCGVMSIVGFVIGLGDRHGENILLQTTNGEVVHVDFNCIFNKGELLEIPERVPFRLTRNLVDAMGPLGWNGQFRKSCEITLRIFRENSQVFLSILEAFVYDPLVEWSKIKSKRDGNAPAGTAAQLAFQARSNSGELSNQRAKDNLTAIAHRLDGRARNLTKELNVSLSIEAQVNYLIRQATDVDNLCQMYVGWGSYY